MFGLAGWEEARTRELLARVMQEYEDPLMRSCIKAYVPPIRCRLALDGMMLGFDHVPTDA